MKRPGYLTEELYRQIQKDAEAYAKDYDAILKRRLQLEEMQQQESIRDEESYLVLESFGAV